MPVCYFPIDGQGTEKGSISLRKNLIGQAERGPTSMSAPRSRKTGRFSATRKEVISDKGIGVDG